MLNLLLDFPWPIESLRSAYSEAFDALNRFERIRVDEELGAVRFISLDDYQRLTENPEPPQPGVANVLGAVLVAINNYVQWTPAQIEAKPIPAPNDCSMSWRRGLGDELMIENWRTPQILVAYSRLAAWAPSIVGRINNAEAVLRRDGHDHDCQRIIATIDDYYDHDFATSDRDPWDLRRWKPLGPGVPLHHQHPCKLPRPRVTEPVPLANLREKVASIANWEIEGGWFFLPEKEWDPMRINKTDWRAGRSFPTKACPHCGHDCPVDRRGMVWCWDKNERHWDVQLQPEYWKISHDGRLLGKAPNTRRFRR